MDDERLEYLAQITSWYYEDNLSQEEIARRIGKSPSLISRLLQEARDRGLLEIRVRFPLKRHTQLEERLCRTFGLHEAWVLANPPDDSRACLNRVGKLGARCLQQRLRDGISIGIGWGTAILAVVHAVTPCTLRAATVVQVVGSVGSGDPTVDGTQMTRALAETIGAAAFHIHAPILVTSELVAQSLRQDPAIADTLRRCESIDVALVGIGTTDPDKSGLLRAGYLSADEMALVRKAGAVGDVVGYHVDIGGKPMDLSINRRVIGMRLETLKRVPTSIAVVSGSVKHAATFAVLNGGYANILVTDANTAAAVVAMAQAAPNNPDAQSPF